MHNNSCVVGESESRRDVINEGNKLELQMYEYVQKFRRRQSNMRLITVL